MRFFSYLLVPILVVAGAYLGATYALSNLRKSADSQEKFVLIRPGENLFRVAQKLEDAGLIYSERSFRWYLKLSGFAGKLKIGEYALRPDMTNAEIVSLIASGKSVLHKFTVPEGHNKFQIAESLAEHGLGTAENFLRAVDSKLLIRASALPTLTSRDSEPSSLEGYLYPDTYMVSRLMSEEEIVKMMVKHFKEVYLGLKAEIEKRAANERPVLTPHELVILASIVEKETGAAKERPMIASVFYNRLRKSMRLQSDPTIIYGMWERDKKFDGNIRRNDLHTETPYNTYTVNRLPRGPIANPGKSALEAVLNPGESNFLYFVSRNDGTHVFTQSYGEHQKAVNILQRNPKMREGKSWRDLPQAERAKNSKI